MEPTIKWAGQRHLCCFYEPGEQHDRVKADGPADQKRISGGGRRVAAYRLLTEQGLVIKETLEFPEAEVDEDGIPILNLRTAKVSNRALNHPRNRNLTTAQHSGSLVDGHS